MSADLFRITVDGVAVLVPRGVSVGAALMNGGLTIRRSVSGEPRAALCGMGICHECHVTIDGVAHRRACLVPAADGMVVETGGAS